MQALVIVLPFFPVYAASAPRVWTHSVIWEGQSGEGVTLILLSVDQRDTKLIGHFVFENKESTDKKARDVTVDGVKDCEGIFWPRVKLEVKRRDSIYWVPVSGPAPVGGPAKILIQPNETNFDIVVNLNPFKALIGKYEAGRITLSSGQESEFDLKELLPPKR